MSSNQSHHFLTGDDQIQVKVANCVHPSVSPVSFSTGDALDSPQCIVIANFSFSIERWRLSILCRVHLHAQHAQTESGRQNKHKLKQCSVEVSLKISSTELRAVLEFPANPPAPSMHLLVNVSSRYRITTKSMPPPPPPLPPPPPPLTACTSRSVRTFTLSSWGWEYLLIARYDNHYYQFPYWKQNNVLNKRDGKCIMREVACRVTFWSKKTNKQKNDALILK